MGTLNENRWALLNATLINCLFWMLEAPCIYQKQLLKGGELEILLLSINWFIPNLSLQFTTNAPPNRDTRPDCRGTRKWHTGSGSIIQFTPATWHWHRSNCDHWPLSLTGYMVHWPLCPDSRHVSIIPWYKTLALYWGS